MSSHLKRLNSPKTWVVLRKTTKYIAKPLPGAHTLGESMSVVQVLKQLGHVQTSGEAKKVLRAHEVLVDGRRVMDVKAGVGLLDTLALPKSNEYYRVVYDHKGRLRLLSIPKAEANTKACKVMNKTTISFANQLSFKSLLFIIKPDFKNLPLVFLADPFALQIAAAPIQ